MSMFSSRRARAARPSPVCARARRSLFESLEARVVLAGDAPTAEIEVVSARPFVEGEAIDFTAHATPGQVGDELTYEWETFFDDSDFVFDPNADFSLDANTDPSSPDYTYQSAFAGTFWVTLKVTDQEGEFSTEVRRFDVVPFDPGQVYLTNITTHFVTNQPIEWEAQGQPINPTDELTYHWEVYRSIDFLKSTTADNTLVFTTSGVDQFDLSFSTATPGNFFIIVRITTGEGLGQVQHDAEESNMFGVDEGSFEIVPAVDAPATASEGEPIDITGTTGLPEGDGFAYVWALYRDGSTTPEILSFATLLEPVTVLPDVNYLVPDEGSYEFRLTIFTESLSGEASSTVVAGNVDPAIDTVSIPTTGGFEGTPIALSASATDVPADTLTYTWTVLKNGNPYASPTGASASFIPDDEGEYSVSLLVTDGDEGSASTTSVDVAVANVNPTVTSLTGPASAVQGQPISYAATVSDAGATDVLSGSWQLRNASNVVIGSGSGLTFNASAPNAGSYTVRFTVNDGDGGSATQTVNLSVVRSALSGGVLTVGAASGGSSVIINPSGGGVSVIVDGTVQSYGSGTSKIVIYGQSGSDVVVVSNSVTIPAWIFGGGGTDVLLGGGGNDVIVGGSGSDVLLGGGGRDLIIGGTGTDILIGDAGDDILIAGYTAHDSDLTALAAIMAIWTNNQTFAQRTTALRASLLVSNGSGINVFDDDALDILTGSAGNDWYFANLVRDNEPILNLDLIADATAAELAAYRELINQ